MVDVVDGKTRSRMMSGIRGRNTKPEILIRSLLHRHGFRFRLHVRDLPGKPDIVLPRYHAVVFVHGCFWHGHDCPLFKWPGTRPDFWREKIGRNRLNDYRMSKDGRSYWSPRFLDEISSIIAGKGKTPQEREELKARSRYKWMNK